MRNQSRQLAPATDRRAGFTMIELMVVIGIIIVLAGLLIPALGLVQRKAQWAKSSNNLQQLHLGIGVYQHDIGRPPLLLSHLFMPLQDDEGKDDNRPNDVLDHIQQSGNFDQSAARHVIDGPLLGQDRDLLLDPADPTPSRGGNENDSNRGVGKQWADIEYVIESEPLPCSYFYEMSGLQHDVDKSRTWYEVKHEGLQRGNIDADGNAIPFDPDYFVIVRSWWHHNWGEVTCFSRVNKVLNLSWNGVVYSSTPWWEADISEYINYEESDCN